MTDAIIHATDTIREINKYIYKYHLEKNNHQIKLLYIFFITYRSLYVLYSVNQ